MSSHVRGPAAAVVVLLCFACTGLADADYESLAAAVAQINSPGTPGPLWPTGEGWATIVSGDRDTSVPSGVVMAREYGAGRVLASAESSSDAPGRMDNRQFTLNIFGWLRQTKPKKVAYTTGHLEWAGIWAGSPIESVLTPDGYTVKSMASPITSAQLSDVSVLLVGCAWSDFTAADISAVRDFVNGGGGLFLMGLGWSWITYHPGKTMDDFPMSKMAAPYGITWLDGYVTDSTDFYIDGPVFHLFYPGAIGMSLQDAFATIDSVNESHAADLPEFLRTDSDERFAYLIAHATLKIPVVLYHPGHPQRDAVYDFYRQMIGRYPVYFTKPAHFDAASYAHMAQVRERVFITLSLAKPLDPSVQAEIASAIGLYGLYTDIWQDFGILLIDNTALEASQQQFLHDCFSLIPQPLHGIRFITVRDFLGQDIPQLLKFSGAFLADEAADGWNIFGVAINASTENSFPADSQVGLIPVFCGCTVHEINHDVDRKCVEGVGAANERRYSLIERAASPDVLFLPHSTGLGVDWTATKANFKAKGFWDGVGAHWTAAWNAYWASGPGVARNDNWLRNNLQLMCEAPHESFATLANQYFTDSDIMLDLCMRRWDRGIKTCINQFLFFADIYSLGGDTTYFYRTDLSAGITRKAVPLERDGQGRITGLFVSGTLYVFGYDSNCDVLTIDTSTWGAIAVNTSPAAASWTMEGPNGYTRHGSGNESFSSMPVGTYTVRWHALAGYNLPVNSPESKDVTKGATTTFSGVYTRQTGTAQVYTDPDTGTWTLTGPDGYSCESSGDKTLANLPTGFYTIAWHLLPYYRPPANSPMTKEIVYGATTVMSGTYTHDLTGPTVSGLAAMPSFVREGVDASLTLVGTADDSSSGGSRIAAAEYFIGPDPGEGDGSAMTPADRAFDSSTEPLTALIATTSWTKGVRRINVRALDSASNWSTPVAHLDVNVFEGVPPGTITDLLAVPARNFEQVTVTVNACSGEDLEAPVTNIADGDAATYWRSAGTLSAQTEYVVLDAGQIRNLAALRLCPSASFRCFPRVLTIEVSADGSTWNPVAAGHLTPSKDSHIWLFGADGSRYIRLSGPGIVDPKTGRCVWEIGEAQVFISGGNTAFSLTWTAPADDGYTGSPASEYDLRYSPSPISPSTFESCARILIGTPKSPGVKENFAVGIDEVAGTFYFALKAADEVPNWSSMSNVTSAQVTQTGIVPIEPVDLQQYRADAESPLFEFAASPDVSSVRILFSSCMNFPHSPCARADGQADSTVGFRLKTGIAAWRPSLSQWKSIKDMTCSENMLYWRVGGKHAQYGMLYGPARRIAFDCGSIGSLTVNPSHTAGGERAVYPHSLPLPVFSWANHTTGMGYFYVDVSSSPSVPLGDKTLALTLGGSGISVEWYKPTSGEWKKVRQVASRNGARVYWRVRARDATKVLECASEVQALVVDGGNLTLNPFSLAVNPCVASWTHTDNGRVTYKYNLQFSNDDSFDNREGWIVQVPVPGTPDTTFTVVVKNQAALLKKAQNPKAPATAVYCRVRAQDPDRAFSTCSNTVQVWP